MPETSKQKKAHYAGRHRDQAHLSAHSENAEGTGSPAVIPDHPLTPRGAASVITSTAALHGLIDRLAKAGRFAYDSEFIGELTYVPNLCLVQVATSQEVALIDPLADVDLTPFWEILCDASVEKIVHAGQQDIEPVVRRLGKAPQNVFDTQIAAGFVGLTYPVSLSKLVMELTGARLGKSLTFSHWDQRPLSQQQLRYAADDVRYLPAVRQAIGDKLDQLGHADWAKEECNALCQPGQYRFDPDRQYLRLRGAGSLPARDLTILRELTVWRDTTAQAHNVPPRTIAKDEVLIDMSRSPIKSLDRLSGVRGLPRPVVQKHGPEIIAAIARGQAASLDGISPPRDHELSPRQKFATEALFSAMQAYCAGQSIDPSLVASRTEIVDLVRHFNSDPLTEPSPVLQGWRNQAVGRFMLDLWNKKLRIELSWSQDCLRSKTIEVP